MVVQFHPLIVKTSLAKLKFCSCNTFDDLLAECQIVIRNLAKSYDETHASFFTYLFRWLPSHLDRAISKTEHLVSPKVGGREVMNHVITELQGEADDRQALQLPSSAPTPDQVAELSEFVYLIGTLDPCVQQTVEMAVDGRSVIEIAKATGVSRPTIYKQLRIAEGVLRG